VSSPGFSKFRDLLDTWDSSIVEHRREENVRALIDNPMFVMFLQLGKEILAGGEGNRIMFASLKNPDEDTEKDASCTMFNLTGIVTGNSGQRIVSKGDIQKAKVIDKDKAFEALNKQVTDDFDGTMNIVVQAEGEE
jgi:hypothetical protein